MRETLKDILLVFAAAAFALAANYYLVNYRSAQNPVLATQERGK
jgi:hypothetical protein